MHQRTWLSILTFPVLAAFTCPVVFESAQDVPKVEIWNMNRDPAVGISDVKEAFTLIDSTYVDKPDMEKVIKGGIQYVLSETHPMNSYLTIGDLRLSDPGPASVGIAVIKKYMYASIISVVPGSPAARFGLKVGDNIRKLNNESVGSMSSWTLERRLRGPVGSDLDLLVFGHGPNNEELRKITLKRELIKAPPITTFCDSRANVVVLTDLNLGRASELKAILEGLNHGIPLILDIRQCAGGCLTEAASVAGIFVDAGPLATIQEVGKPPVALSVMPANIRTFTNVAVIQGGYTIGASEALSSALKRQFIPVFGSCTYGLGLERTRFLLKHGGAAEIVNKYWLGASGELLGSYGKKTDDPGSAMLKDDLGVPIRFPDHYGVLPNYVIEADNSKDSWLPKVLEVIESRHKCSAVSLPITGKLTFNN